MTLKRSEYSGFSGNNKYLWTLYTGYFNFVFLFAYQICTTTCTPFILPGKDILNLTTENIYSLSTKESSWLCNDFHLKKYEVTKYTCIGQKTPEKQVYNKYEWLHHVRTTTPLIKKLCNMKMTSYPFTKLCLATHNKNCW